MSGRAGRFTSLTVVAVLLGSGCSPEAPTPDAEAVDARGEVEARVDVTHDVDVVRPIDARDDAAIDRAEVDAGDAGADALDVAGAEDASETDDASETEDATADMDVVLPAEDATADMDVVNPSDDGTPDMDVVLPIDDAAAMDAAPVVDAPDTDLGSPADAVFDAPPAVDACTSCCTRDEDCDALYRCVRQRCEPRWNTCPGAPLRLDGTPVRVDPSTLSGPFSLPTTSCGWPLHPGAVAALSFVLSTISDVQLRVSGVPADARVEVTNGCGGPSAAFGTCMTGSVDQRLRAMPAGTWFVIVDATRFPSAFEVSATAMPRSQHEAEVCPGVEIIPDTLGTVLYPSTYDWNADVRAGVCLAPARIDWAARFTLRETRDVTLRVDYVGAPPYQAAVTLATACGGVTLRPCEANLTAPIRYRALSAGTYTIVGYQLNSASPVRVSVTTAPPNDRRAVGDYCPTAPEVTPDGPAVSVDLRPLDLLYDLGTSCSPYPAGWYQYPDAVWRFSLSARRAVRVTVSGGAAFEVRRGCGVDTPRVSDCVRGTRGRESWTEVLDPGEYSVVAARDAFLGSDPGAISVAVATAPTPRPRVAGDGCDAPLALPVDGTPVRISPTSFDASPDLETVFSRQSLTADWGDAALRFTLDRRSDVTVRAPSFIGGFWWQLQRRCGRGDGLVLVPWTDGPQTFRALSAGDYFLVGAWSGGYGDAVTVSATATESPARELGDTCAEPLTLSPDASPVTVDARRFTGFEHGPRAMTQTRFTRVNVVDFVYRYEHPPGEDLVAEVTGSRTFVYAEQRAACDDGDTNVGPAAGVTGSRAWTIPLRRTADGVGYLIVATGLPIDGLPVPVTVAIRRGAPPTAPSYVPSPAPANVVWTNACDLPGATRVLRRASDATSLASLPFPFRFFGHDYPAGHPVHLTTGGFLTFEPVETSPRLSILPAVPSVAAFFGAPTDAGDDGVCTTVVGDAPQRRWIVSWPSLRQTNGLLARGMVVLHERGTIDIVALDMVTEFNRRAGLFDLAGAGPLSPDSTGLVFPNGPYMTFRFDPIP